VDMLQEFHRLLAYNAWANREVLASVRNCPDLPPRYLERVAHILSAEALWLERLRQVPQTHPVWPQFSLEQCACELEDGAQRWNQYLAALKPVQLEQAISYKNSKGEPWSSKVGDILMHVVLHSAYHRGQIASDMRGAGFTPAYTDFIHGVRQGFVD
jgi:uncharacterized damage-inducible protein DinB